jgi:hypothetical protein
VVIELVVQDAVTHLLGGRDPADEVVEGGPRVEHHRPQLTACVSERRQVDADPLLLEAGQPEAVRQPLGRVDGEHHRLAAVQRTPQAHGGRGGRFPDPSGAHTHHQVHLL